MAIPRVNSQGLLVLGSGGLARELAELLDSETWPGAWFAGFVVPDGDTGVSRSRLVVGTDSQFLDLLGERGYVVGVGSPSVRAQLLSRFEVAGAGSSPSLVHPSAEVARSSDAERRSVFVGAGVVISSNVDVGEGVLVNWNATVGHDAVLGRCCVVAPGANIGGFAHLGPECLVGSGAQVLPGVRIGQGAVVGAGAVVTQDVAEGVVVIGNPARPLKRRES